MISTRLRSARERRGFTRDDLSQRTGISSRQIARYEDGDNDPTAEVVATIARVLEVSVDYLVGLVDEPDQHLTEKPLTALEWRLLQAFRAGRISESLKIVASAAEIIEQNSSASNKPAVNG